MKDTIRTKPSCTEGFRNDENKESSNLNDTHSDDELDDEVCVNDECRNEVEVEEEDSLEWMIETMMKNNDDDDDKGETSNSKDVGICADPRHFHSFTSSNIAITNYFLRPTCSFCNERISNYYHIVKCVACGTYAHRSCSFSTTNPNNNSNSSHNKCPVNQLKIDTKNNNDNHNTIKPENNETHEEPTIIPSTQPNYTDDDQSIKEDTIDAQELIHVSSEVQQNNDHHNESNEQQSAQSSIHYPYNENAAKEHVKSLSTTPPTSQEITENSEDEERIDSCWSTNGPPQHWASTQTIENIANSKKPQSNKSIFHNVSCVLQEHVTLFKKSHLKTEENESIEENDNNDDVDNDQNNSKIENLQHQEQEKRKDPLVEMVKDNSNSIVQISLQNQDKTHDSEEDKNDNAKEENLKPILKEKNPKPPPPSNLKKAKEIGKAVNHIRNVRNDWTVYAAGTLAGSVAGLVIAGPAGVMLGAKVGQVAGLVLEGSMSVGVLAASGVLAWTTTKNHLLQNREERVLKIGDKSKSNLVLVRPGITVDPIWQLVTGKAREQYHEYITRSNNESLSSKFNILALQTKPSPEKELKDARSRRLQKDSDIISANEYEIETEEKIMLLVSRMLNDRMSLPGFIYRYLINEHRNRATKSLLKEKQNSTISETKGSVSSIQTEYSRTKREDTHAVIKHVTATLLEVRPGFAASPRITAMSANSVESLVFGELYDSIFDEIVTENRQMDESLQIKITEFDSEQQQKRRLSKICDSHLYYEYLSDSALDALRRLPESHSAVQKLAFCVHFLELISVHFDDENKNDSPTKKRRTMGADALLKMVCQHIIAAKIPNLNAEIAFIEEFARDEQLLRGKEGYALVTIQASLNFLNASENFEEDIFYHEDD